MNVLKVIFLVIVMVMISSCNEQRSRSTAYSKNNNNGLTSLGGTNYKTGTTTTDGRIPAGTIDSGTGRVDDKSTLPPEVAHCKFALDTKSALEIPSSSLGAMTICKSKEDDRIIYTQFEKDQTARILMFPTYHSGTKSFYIGSPVYNIQETTLAAYKIYKYELEKNRKGFENYPITGVMMMKDEVNFYPFPFQGPYRNNEAYMMCNDWLYHSNDSRYCNAFKAVGKYVYKVF
jgi:hypothetical protein